MKQTFGEARRYGDFIWLLACTVAYQGGVAVAITLAAIYAEQVIGFLPQETMVLILVLNVAAAAGAFGCGHLQDRIGHKLTLGLTLLGWIATCVIAALASTKGQFWVAATIAGLCMGSCQSVGRAMVGLFAPRAAAGRVLRPVELCHPAGQHRRSAGLRADHLGHRRQPARGDRRHRGAVRAGADGAGAD